MVDPPHGTVSSLKHQLRVRAESGQRSQTHSLPELFMGLPQNVQSGGLLTSAPLLPSRQRAKKQESNDAYFVHPV